MVTATAETIQGEVAGLADFEIQNLSRTRPIRYNLTLPPNVSDSNPAYGLIFYIPGFGEDASDSYFTKLHHFLAEEYHYAVCTVEYHCFRTRPTLGANVNLTADANQKLALLCELHHMPLQADQIFAILNTLGQRLKEHVVLPATLLPPDDEYQNFGVLQALDHLVVLNDLMDEGLPINWQNVVAVGSSHGGYIAHLMAKFAPNSINAVLDNSSYTKTPLSYLGCGEEYEYGMPSGNLFIACRTHTLWQFNARQHPNFFGLPQFLIRETVLPSHLETSLTQTERKPQYYCFNSTTDTVSPLNEKRIQVKRLQDAGFECQFTEVTPNMIDGKRFKTMDHGMNASMKTLCKDILPKIQPRETTLDRNRQTRLVFDCIDANYVIEHTSTAPYLQCRIEAKN